MNEIRRLAGPAEAWRLPGAEPIPPGLVVRLLFPGGLREAYIPRRPA